MKALTFTGSWVAATVLATVVLILSLTHRVPFRAVAAVLLAWLGEILAVTLNKWLVQRPGPPESVRLVVTHGWSFPSGHTANTVVVFATTAALVVILFDRKYVSVVTWALCIVVTAVVGFSRIELGAHWTTDVAASWAWTACWLLTLFVILRRPLWSSRGLRSTNKPALTERANDPD
jgi:undecaprenyl-diphosphatase